MSNFLDVPETVDRASLYSVASVKPSPDTLTKLVKRLRALTLALLPVEVDPAAINESTGRIITPGVISAYQTAAGDFVEAVYLFRVAKLSQLPYCLLRARAEFMWDANHNPADYGENVGRAIACEVLARRIVHLSPPDRLRSIMSSRYQHRQLGGGESDMTSALEVAIDSHWYATYTVQCTMIYIKAAQYSCLPMRLRKVATLSFLNHAIISYFILLEVVAALWKGDLIQHNIANNRIDCKHGFCLIRFLVREPLERLGESHGMFDEWEIVLYIMALAFTMEGMFFDKLFR
ncbi:hypothetical protein C0989_003451 [Termitomyces sp. Mn162]|nr:hypothetical protein C0989_003451 [Termitomyces sp. Mn162]